MLGWWGGSSDAFNLHGEHGDYIFFMKGGQNEIIILPVWRWEKCKLQQWFKGRGPWGHNNFHNNTKMYFGCDGAKIMDSKTTVN